MKNIKKTIGGIIAAIAVFLGSAFCSVGVNASADVIGDPCAFDAIQVQQVKKAPDWSTAGEAAGQMFLNFAVEKSDWTGATAIRIRLQSLNNGDFLSNDSAGNNIAVAIGAKSTQTDNTIWEINKPYSDVKYVYPTGEAGPQLYFINTNTSYFVVPREYTGYVELQLNDTTWKAESGTVGRHIRARSGETDASELDMSAVKFVSIKFEPLNYEGIVMNFGDIEINVNGTWETVVDASEVDLVTKSSDKTWSEAIAAMTANQAMMDPCYVDSVNVNTSAFELREMQATPCASHVDLAGDGVCDRCFEMLPHVAWDIDANGLCDDCNEACCGEGLCVDNDNNGYCDTCEHVVENDETDDSSNSSNSSNSSGGGNEDKPEKGCKGTLSGALGTVFMLMGIYGLYVLKRKE